MSHIKARIKEVYERKLGRELAAGEVDEIALWYQQFAMLLLRWSQDEKLSARLGVGDQQGANGEHLAKIRSV